MIVNGLVGFVLLDKLDLLLMKAWVECLLGMILTALLVLLWKG
jgi:hypothetical protein